MSSPLWSKAGARGADEEVQAFLAGEDVRLDRELFAFDLAATRAHVEGLGRIGLLTDDEVDRVTAALRDLAEAFAAGRYELGPPHEDGHSAIEAFLTERLGGVGRKVHAGRSRNDQVQVALRLYLRDRLAQLDVLCRSIAEVALGRARRDGQLAMPGYTHLQRAVPSTVGLWLAAIAEAFIDLGELATWTRRWIDRNPLGSAAGYGVNLPLDRDHTTAALGFARLQVNPMYVQNSRGRFELQALAALGQTTLEVRRIAWDLSLFTSEEFRFVALPDRYTTGSSIMPNKRNPDVVELLRALHATVAGASTEIEAVLALPSGYHRDLQATKGPLLRAWRTALPGLRLVPPLLDELRFDAAAMAAAISPPMYATDIAIERARAGQPFREAYQTPPDPDDLAGRSPAGSIAARVSPGACADLRLDELGDRLAALAAGSPSR